MAADIRGWPPERRQGRRDSGVARAQAGATLIDVLVSIVLVSIGTIGMLGLLVNTLQVGANAQDRNRAALLASELAATMWLNNSTNISNAPLATAYKQWQAAVPSSLYANASGLVTLDGAVATITISWTAPNQSSTTASNSVNTYDNKVVKNFYTTEVVIP